jgi:hypothetical protein
VEGRAQGDPRPRRRAPLRLSFVSACVFFAIVAASVALSLVEVLPRVEHGIARDSKLTPVERQHAAGDRLELDMSAFDAFKARLHPRERYSVDVPPGEPGPFITEGAVVRAFAAYYFLPAIQVPQARLVFHYRFP